MGECTVLKAYRKLYKIKAQEMAELLGITLPTYCNKENGKATFTILEAKTIANKFNKTIDEIFFNDNVILE